MSKTRVIAARVPRPLYERIRAEAETRHTSMIKILAELVEEGLRLKSSK